MSSPGAERVVRAGGLRRLTGEDDIILVLSSSYGVDARVELVVPARAEGLRELMLRKPGGLRELRVLRERREHRRWNEEL